MIVISGRTIRVEVSRDAHDVRHGGRLSNNENDICCLIERNNNQK